MKYSGISGHVGTERLGVRDLHGAELGPTIGQLPVGGIGLVAVDYFGNCSPISRRIEDRRDTLRRFFASLPPDLPVCLSGEGQIPTVAELLAEAETYGPAAEECGGVIRTPHLFILE